MTINTRYHATTRTHTWLQSQGGREATRADVNACHAGIRCFAFCNSSSLPDVVIISGAVIVARREILIFKLRVQQIQTASNPSDGQLITVGITVVAAARIRNNT